MNDSLALHRAITWNLSIFLSRWESLCTEAMFSSSFVEQHLHYFARLNGRSSSHLFKQLDHLWSWKVRNHIPCKFEVTALFSSTRSVVIEEFGVILSLGPSNEGFSFWRFCFSFWKFSGSSFCLQCPEVSCCHGLMTCWGDWLAPLSSSEPSVSSFHLETWHIQFLSRVCYKGV